MSKQKSSTMGWAESFEYYDKVIAGRIKRVRRKAKKEQGDKTTAKGNR